jgi:hypothetical protein
MPRTTSERRLAVEAARHLERNDENGPRRGGKLPHRPYYKITCNALQRPGEEVLQFRLATPAAAGVPVDKEGRGTFKATALGLSARAGVADSVHYSLEMSLVFPAENRQQQKTSMEFQNMFNTYLGPEKKPAEPTVTKITKKFVDFKVKLKEKYPYLHTVPHVRPLKDPPHNIIYQMELPPRSSLFCNNPFVWQALRFPEDLLEEKTVVLSTGAKKYYGYVNTTLNRTVTSSRPLLEDEFPTAMWTMASSGGGTAVVAPVAVVMEAEISTDWLLQTLAEKKKLDRSTSGEALVRLIRTGLLQLNMEARTLTVDVTTPGRIVLQSRKQEGVNEIRVDLTVRLSTPLKDYFLLDSPTLLFPGNDAKTITLMHREAVLPDPLAGRYPLHLVAPGRSEARHYLEGEGWVTLLGIMAGPHKFIGATEWVELGERQRELRLILVDRWCQRVGATSLTEYFLNLELF